MLSRCRTRSEPCTAFENGEPCGETQTLAILNEFQKLYENKLKEIDESGDCYNKSEEKIKTLQCWVNDLTEQNHMLVQAVEELEDEASKRVALLESKLQEHTQETYNRMSDAYSSFNKQQSELVQCLRSDITNLLEVIRRARDDGLLSAEGLTFYEVRCVDIYGNKNEPGHCQLKEDVKEISSLSSRVEQLEKEKCKLQVELENVTGKLKQKTQENENLRLEQQKLEKSARDMRDALTAEVADKHDSIRALRREYQQLEEQCRQIDKQAHFKDDIIKELRKELRAIKKNDGKPVQYDVISKVNEVPKQITLLKNAADNLKSAIDSKYDIVNDKEEKILNIDQNVEELNELIIKSQKEFENWETISGQYLLGMSEIDRCVKRNKDRLHQLLDDCKDLENIDRINLIVKEIKKIEHLMKEKENKINKQDYQLEKMKKLLHYTKTEFDRLQEISNNYLQDKLRIENKLMESVKKIENLQKEFLDLFELVKTDIMEMYHIGTFLDINEIKFKDLEQILSEIDSSLSLYSEKTYRTTEYHLKLHNVVKNYFQKDFLINCEKNEPLVLSILDELQRVYTENLNVFSDDNDLIAQNRDLNNKIENIRNEICKIKTSIQNTPQTVLTKKSVSVGTENFSSSCFCNLKEQLANALIEIKRLEQLVVVYEVKISEMKKSGCQCEDNQNKIEHLRRKVTELEYAIQSKDAINDNLQKAINFHQNTITELKKQCETVQMNNDTQQQLIDNLQEELESVKRELSNLESKHAQELNYLNETIDSLKYELNCLEELYFDTWSELIKYSENESNLRETIFELEIKCYYLEQDNLVLEIQLKNSMNQLRMTWRLLPHSQNTSEIEKILAEKCRLDETVVQLRIKLADLESICYEKTDLINKLNDLLNKQKLINEIQNMLDKSEQINTETQVADDIVSQLKQKILDGKKLERKIAEKEKIIEELQETIHKMEVKDVLENTVLQSVENSFQEQIYNLNDDLSIQKHFVAKILKIFGKSECESANEETLKEIVDELQQSVNQRTLLENMIHEKEIKISDLNSKIHKMESNYVPKDILEEALSDCAKKSLECSVLNMNLETTESELKTLKDQMRFIEVELKQNNVKQTELINNLNATENELIQSQESIKCLDTLKSELIHANSVIIDLKTRLKECKCEDYIKEIGRQQAEIEHLKMELSKGFLDRDHFYKMTDDLLVGLIETKQYLEYLKNLLANDTYSDQLEDKNCQLACTIIEMDKLIKFLKSELADASTLAEYETKNKILYTTQINELKNLLKEKQLEIQRLKDILKVTTSSLKSASQINSELDVEISKLREEVISKTKQQELSLQITDQFIDEVNFCKSSFVLMQQKVNSLKSTLARKSKKLHLFQHDYQVQINTLKALRETIFEEKQNYQNEIEKLQNTVSNLHDELKSLKEYCELLENQISAEDQNSIQETVKNQQLNKDEQIHRENIALKEIVIKMEYVISNLKLDLKNSEKKYTDLKIEFDHIFEILRNQNNNLSDSKVQLTDALNSNQIERERYEMNLKEKDNLIEKLNSLIDSHQSKINEQSHKIELLNNKLIEIEKQSENQTLAYETTISNMEMRLEDVQTECDREIMNKEQSCLYLCYRVSMCEYQLQKVEEHNKSLEETVVQKDRLIHELYKAHNDYLKSQSSQESRQIRETNENYQIEELKKKLTCLKKFLKEKELEASKVIDARENEICTLKRNCENALIRRCKEIQDLKLKLKNNENSIRIKDNRITNYEKELEELKKQITTRDLQIENLKAHQIEFNGHTSETNIKFKTFQDTLKQKEQQIDDFQTNFERNLSESSSDLKNLFRQERQSVKETFDKYRKHICELKKYYETQIKKLKHLNQTNEQKIIRLNQKNLEIEKKLKETEDKNNHLINCVRENQNQMEKINRDSQKTFQKLNDKYSAIVEDWEQLSSENACLIETINCLRQKVEKFRFEACNKIQQYRKQLEQKVQQDGDSCQNGVQEKYELFFRQQHALLKNLKHDIFTKTIQNQYLTELAENLRCELHTRNVSWEKLLISREEQWKTVVTDFRLKIQYLKNVNYQFKKTINQLNCEIKENLNKNNTQNSIINDLQAEVSHLKATIDQNQSDFRCYKNQMLNRRKQDLDEFNKQLLEKNEELCNLKMTLHIKTAKINKFVKDFNDLQSLYNDKIVELNEIKTKMLTNQNNSWEIKKYQSKCENLEQINLKLQSKLGKVKHIIQYLVKKNKYLKNQITIHENQMENPFQLILTECRVQYETLLSNFQRIQESNFEKEAEINDLKQQLNKLKNDCENKYKMLENNLTKKTEEITKMDTIKKHMKPPF